MSDTPDKSFTMPTPAQAVAEENVRLERERDAALDAAMDTSRKYQDWRKCAEKLAKTLRKEWKVRALICYGDAHEALAEFERLRGEIK